MSQTISFMSANYVARTLGYQMTGGWMQGDKATNDHFRPIETFAARFDEVLTDIRALGFDALDLWIAHLNPIWATPEHIASAKDLLASHNLQVVSLAGGFGKDAAAFEQSCTLATALGVSILGGNTPLLASDYGAVVALLEQHNLTLGLENHPEKTPQEVMDKLGDSDRVGVALDTGWFGTHGYDAAKAIEELATRLVHVHLKDVLDEGAHETCRYGQGVVPIEVCVETLKTIGYAGAISIEHEPEQFDPNDDCRECREKLQRWLDD